MRGDEVLQWLDINALPHGVRAWVCLDDGPLTVNSATTQEQRTLLRKNIIACDSSTGLTKKLAKRALQRLRAQLKS